MGALSLFVFPKSCYILNGMTNEELKKLDAELTEKESRLVKQLDEMATQNPAIKGDYDPKMPDYGNDDEENLNEATVLPDIVAMTDELERQLKDVRETRQKIKEGTYGSCSNCKSPIPSERLKALPTARFCISCAQNKLN